MKYPIAIIATLLTTLPSSAESLPHLTLDQLIPGGKDYLTPEALKDPHWEGDCLIYTLNDTTFTTQSNGKIVSKVSKEDQTPLKQKPSEGEISADLLWKAINDGDRLWVEHTKNGQRVEVSCGEENGIVWGQAVHRNEFGIMKGTFWSPTGHMLAFYRMDESMVTDYPLVDTDPRVASVKNIKYPMAGMDSHQVTIGIFNPETRQTTYLKTDSTGRTPICPSLSAPDHYLTCVTWRPDGKQIFVAELNRAQNLMELNVYDVATGDFVQTLFVEQNSRYVEPEHSLLFLPGSNDRFIWQSERDGWNHLYLCELKGEKHKTNKTTSIQNEVFSFTNSDLKIKQLTHGSWMVTDIVGFDPQGKNLYYLSTQESPLEDHLYELNLKTLKNRRLTSDPGMHSVIMNNDYTAFLDIVRSHKTPRLSQIVQVKSLKKHTLHNASDPYEGYAVPQIEVGTLKADDGETDLYYRLVKPIDFDADKRYPVVVYLYNGPHAQMITEGWNYTARGWDIHMAGLGYVVFTIDGRGSDRRGLEFEQAIWHHLGEVEGKDQMTGIKYLQTLSYVDPDRIGIHGWSYGGFMTTYMMLHYPETFKVGVAGGPVLDWSRYEVMYGERYMGTPSSNPNGYKNNNLIEKADLLKGRLLLIHDDQDPTVVPQMSYQFLKKAIEKRTYPDLFIYPGHGHNVRGIDRVHLHEIITRYFENHLK